MSEDSSLLAVGFTDSIIKVWTLVPQKLRAMKSAEQLQDIDREAGKDSMKCRGYKYLHKEVVNTSYNHLDCEVSYFDTILV